MRNGYGCVIVSAIAASGLTPLELPGQGGNAGAQIPVTTKRDPQFLGTGALGLPVAAEGPLNLLGGSDEVGQRGAGDLGGLLDGSPRVIDEHGLNPGPRAVGRGRGLTRLGQAASEPVTGRLAAHRLAAHRLDGLKLVQVRI